MIAVCLHCERRVTFRGELPERCPSCGMGGEWRSVDDPATPYVLTRDDRAWLRSMWIAAED